MIDNMVSPGSTAATEMKSPPSGNMLKGIKFPGDAANDASELKFKGNTGKEQEPSAADSPSDKEISS